MDFWTIEIKTKFKEKAIVDKLQKDIIDKFNYECSKNKDYMAQVIIGVSNINPRYVIGIYNEKTGKCGRPKKKKDLIKENDLTKIVYGNLYTEWHIHILALTSPGETFARIIKEYIDKKYNDMLDYFNLFYSEEKKTKKEKEYKEKARIRKIAERYDEINNKVRKKSSSKNNKYINVIKV